MGLNAVPLERHCLPSPPAEIDSNGASPRRRRCVRPGYRALDQHQSERHQQEGRGERGAAAAAAVDPAPRSRPRWRAAREPCGCAIFGATVRTAAATAGPFSGFELCCSSATRQSAHATPKSGVSIWMCPPRASQRAVLCVQLWIALGTPMDEGATVQQVRGLLERALTLAPVDEVALRLPIECHTCNTRSSAGFRCRAPQVVCQAKHDDPGQRPLIVGSGLARGRRRSLAGTSRHYLRASRERQSGAPARPERRSSPRCLRGGGCHGQVPRNARQQGSVR